MKKYSGTISGLGVAILICSILAVVGGIAFTTLLGGGGALLLKDEKATAQMTEELNSSLEKSDVKDLNNVEGADVLRDNDLIDEQGKFTPTATSGMVGFLMAFCMALGIAFIIGGLFTLVASIIAIRRANYPERYNTVFIWSIIAAVICLLSGRLIVTALFIIMAVYAYKGNPANQPEPVVIPVASIPSITAPSVVPNPTWNSTNGSSTWNGTSNPEEK